MIACKECNVLRGKRDYYEARLLVQLKNYCLGHHLPMTLNDEDACNIIREGITGGLSIVHHRINIKDETHINHLKFELENRRVISYDTPHVMTHVYGTEFNSLFPSSFSSQYNENIPYTGHKMYMPGKLLGVIKVDRNDKCELEKAKSILNSSIGQKFIATIKGHIPK